MRPFEVSTAARYDFEASIFISGGLSHCGLLFTVPTLSSHVLTGVPGLRVGDDVVTMTTLGERSRVSTTTPRTTAATTRAEVRSPSRPGRTIG